MEWGLGGDRDVDCLGVNLSSFKKAPKLVLISQYCSRSASENPSRLHRYVILQYYPTNTPELSNSTPKMPSEFSTTF